MSWTRSDDAGQALVIAAAGAFMLALAFALTIDWGYGLLQRRIAQNDADKVALEVGRLLTTSVGLSGSTSTFLIAGQNSTSVTRQRALTHVDACAAAINAYQRDRSRPLTNPAVWLDFERWSPGSTSLDPTSYVRANCAPGKPRTVAVDRSTTTVRVRVEYRYRPFFAALLRQPELVVGATSRVALAGAPYTIDPVDQAALAAQGSVSRQDYADLAQSASAIVRTWPLARRFNSSSDLTDLTRKRPCGPACDPRTATPLDFVVGGSLFDGVSVLDLSSQSSRVPAMDQLITEPQSGTTLTDWFADGFGGVLGLQTDWAPPLGPAGQDAVPALRPDRSACTRVPAWLTPPPSCGSDGDTRGDWVETMSKSASTSSLTTIVGAMHVLLQSQGTTTAYSNTTIPNGGGRTFGRALVVWIQLWDCGQPFANGHWQSGSSESCRTSPVSDTDPVRVHLFSVIPVTFYEGLVTNTTIRGYWGGNFVAAGRCRLAPGSCPPITPLANTAFLVADDQRWDPTNDGINEDQNNNDECQDVACD